MDLLLGRRMKEEKMPREEENLASAASVLHLFPSLAVYFISIYLLNERLADFFFPFFVINSVSNVMSSSP